MRRVLVLIVLAFAVACAPARAQDVQLQAPFTGSYSVKDLGPPPGVPSRLGGLTLKAGTTDRLLIGGEADGSTGALYEVRLNRDSGGHISGFAGTAKRYADAAYNDGGVTSPRHDGDCAVTPAVLHGPAISGTDVMERG